MNEMQKFKVACCMVLVAVVGFLIIVYSRDPTPDLSPSERAAAKFEIVNEYVDEYCLYLTLKNKSGKNYNNFIDIKVFLEDGTSYVKSGNAFDFSAGDIKKIKYPKNNYTDVIKSWSWYSVDN